jgi:hypothetical protein
LVAQGLAREVVIERDIAEQLGQRDAHPARDLPQRFVCEEAVPLVHRMKQWQEWGRLVAPALDEFLGGRDGHCREIL